MSIQALHLTGAARLVSRGMKVLQRPRQMSFGVRVRHEVVAVTVMHVGACHYLRCCPQYPTGTCAMGNHGVRSSRNNVASSCEGRQPRS